MGEFFYALLHSFHFLSGTLQCTKLHENTSNLGVTVIIFPLFTLNQAGNNPQKHVMVCRYSRADCTFKMLTKQLKTDTKYSNNNFMEVSNVL